MNSWYPPILVQHGVSASSEFWLRSGAKSPAFLLVEAGFNVFLGNNRGSVNSRGHQTLDIRRDAKKYFDYSFYELGAYDLPAMIDKI